MLVGLATSAGAQGSAIPTVFQGEWSQSLETCADPNEDANGLTIGAASLTLYDGRATVASVEAESATKITVVADWNAEGRSFRETHQLMVSDDGDELSITGIGRDGKAVMIRCPA
ncbi:MULTISPECIES: hypothetical protein [Asticcacaulis]|uniref:hypothetical protein n=1 Tax=Asticcacaulis TaxID=76890 RepID=UPI001AE6E0D2|nr:MULTISPECIES: hypothetical protein [Asticcacaulis]MBP2158184.1 hypothetical protein [Asticcacaulis solisilvae]MDR6799229.1 hypothetical protein [Asticcacaulis sp. BE141]